MCVEQSHRYMPINSSASSRRRATSTKVFILVSRTARRDQICIYLHISRCLLVCTCTHVNYIHVDVAAVIYWFYSAPVSITCAHDHVAQRRDCITRRTRRSIDLIIHKVPQVQNQDQVCCFMLAFSVRERSRRRTQRERIVTWLTHAGTHASK